MKIAAFVAWVVAVAPATLQPLAWGNKVGRKKASKRHKGDKISTTT